jgi:Tol biopolymer transport system component
LIELSTTAKLGALALLALGAFCGPAGAIEIKQDSTPEALAPSTNRLVLKGPVTDGGVRLQLFRVQGEGVEWSHDGQFVVYDCKHKDGYYNIHVCRADGTDDHCLTCLDNGLPHRHAGSPTWSPDGKYIAFAAEKKTHPGGSIEAIPGFGGHSDIWVMTSDGRKAWPLTDTGDTKNDGVIIPKFSHDGRKLSWTERVGEPRLLRPRDQFGDWVVKVADFVETPDGPHLAEVRTFAPGGTGFYEAYGFSPDDRRIIFCSDFDQPGGAFHSQIFAMDATDGHHVQRLTSGNAYNEHASYSPNGRNIVWMTNLGNKTGGTDWWIMHADGSNPRRLTYFNQPDHPESTKGAVFACLTHWSPDGLSLLGGVQYSLLKQEGRILLMTLDKSVVEEPAKD